MVDKPCDEFVLQIFNGVKVKRMCEISNIQKRRFISSSQNDMNDSMKNHYCFTINSAMPIHFNILGSGVIIIKDTRMNF